MQRLRLPESIGMDVETWRLELEPQAALPESDWAVLAENERDRALRLHRHADKVRFVCSRAALRRLLGQRLGCMPQVIRLAPSPHGKPRLMDGAGPDFNVSHAGRYALIALARRGHIGVDIERCDAALDTAGLAPLVFSPLERQLGPGQRPGFFESWVAKEAVLKALGLGVAEHLQQLSVAAPVAADPHRFQLHCAPSAWPTLAAWRLQAPPGYVSALAWTAGPIPLIQ